MATIELKRRKTIELTEDAFRSLSVKAAASGTNLKKYIENILTKQAEEVKDTELYKYLCANDHEGQEIVSSQEKEEFENWLGV